MEAAAVGFEVVTNLGVLGQADVAVNNRAPKARVAAEVHMIVDDGIGDFAVAVDAHIVADTRFLYARAGDDGTAGNNGIERHAHAIRIGKDELRRGILVLPSTQRPGA